jgi:hypothetical protein
VGVDTDVDLLSCEIGCQYVGINEVMSADGIYSLVQDKAGAIGWVW